MPNSQLRSHDQDRPAGNPVFLEILRSEYIRRASQNPAFSMRAFSGFLGLNPTALSDVLNSRTGLSELRAKQVASCLNLDANLAQIFLLSASATCSRSNVIRKHSKQKLQELLEGSQITRVTLDSFAGISHWSHWAVLELINSRVIAADNENLLSQRLGINLDAVQIILKDLANAGLLDTKNVSGQQLVTAGSQISNASIRNFHKSMLQKAILAIDQQDIAEREYSSNNFIIAKEQLPQAKQKILEFRRNLVKWAESHPEREHLYTLNINLFSLDAQSGSSQ